MSSLRKGIISLMCRCVVPGGVEMGQGLHTKMIQIASEELDWPQELSESCNVDSIERIHAWILTGRAAISNP